MAKVQLGPDSYRMAQVAMNMTNIYAQIRDRNVMLRETQKDRISQALQTFVRTRLARERMGLERQRLNLLATQTEFERERYKELAPVREAERRAKEAGARIAEIRLTEAEALEPGAQERADLAMREAREKAETAATGRRLKEIELERREMERGLTRTRREAETEEAALRTETATMKQIALAENPSLITENMLLDLAEKKRKWHEGGYTVPGDLESWDAELAVRHRTVDSRTVKALQKEKRIQWLNEVLHNTEVGEVVQVPESIRGQVSEPPRFRKSRQHDVWARRQLADLGVPTIETEMARQRAEEMKGATQYERMFFTKPDKRRARLSWGLHAPTDLGNLEAAIEEAESRARIEGLDLGEALESARESLEAARSQKQNVIGGMLGLKQQGQDDFLLRFAAFASAGRNSEVKSIVDQREGARSNIAQNYLDYDQATSNGIDTLIGAYRNAHHAKYGRWLDGWWQIDLEHPEPEREVGRPTLPPTPKDTEERIDALIESTKEAETVAPTPSADVAKRRILRQASSGIRAFSKLVGEAGGAYSIPTKHPDIYDKYGEMGLLDREQVGALVEAYVAADNEGKGLLLRQFVNLDALLEMFPQGMRPVEVEDISPEKFLPKKAP